ncbi:3-hydroxybutyryl-CoA dehydrogenase [Rhodococcus sp. NPDC056743]|uniref:3-hydroxybutyryl-CoA dehydrogenase n=1 Tax=Rhodococcus sp. NPDC056743 TaxID=3345934 RepID=UPI00366BE3FA
MHKIGIVGGGTMGAGIAEVCAVSGTEVLLLETSDDVAEASRQRISGSLARKAATGRIDETIALESMSRVHVTTAIADLADRELVIEAASENEVVKNSIFEQLDGIVASSAILATNTSSIPIARVGKNCWHSERVVGVHFFNPVPAMPLVEVIPSLITSPDVVQQISDFVATKLRKTVVHAGDRAGFIVNALLIPYLCAAIRMVESGYASADDVDAAMKGGCGYPMGPLTLTDTIGLDVVLAIAESLYTEFAETQFAAPVLLKRMVDAGRLGKKTGRGFYAYD